MSIILRKGLTCLTVLECADSAINFSTMSSAILNVRGLKLEWILIGCQCFIVLKAIDSNDNVSLYRSRYGCGVNSAFL